jgi:FlaA1/EpsC-like NDP-sugar epimerase
VAKKTWRVGLVGVGAAAQINHIPALKKTEDVELVALCDRDPEKAARVAQKFQVSRFSSRLDELLEDESIDAIDICTPTTCTRPWRPRRSKPASTCCASVRWRAAPTRQGRWCAPRARPNAR